jgi:TetR/AcrR family transcriptional repressor of nem operon
VETAAVEFRRHGIHGIGLADLMSAAGLTHGGFYKHFDSKEHVVEESLTLAVESMTDRMAETLASIPGKRGLHAAITNYLSMKHRDDAANGCPFVAMGGEVARSSDAVRDAMTAGLSKMADLIAGRLEGMSPAAARKTALMILSAMIGAATMARMVIDENLSAAILEQTRKHLIRLTEDQ